MLENERKGISLIVLIITIVVIIILGTAIIVNIAQTNIIKNANEAVYKQDVAVIQDILNIEIDNIILEKKELPVLYTDITYTEKVTDKVQINTESSNIGKVYYLAGNEKGCIVFGKEGVAKEKQIIEIAANEEVQVNEIIYRYTNQELPAYNKEAKWYVTSNKDIILEIGNVIVENDDNNENNNENNNDEIVESNSVAGFYDENDNLLVSWDDLVNNYGLDIQKDYTSSNYNTETTSPYYILNNNTDLENAIKLIIDDNITNIGDYALYSCSKLIYVEMPNTITSIGNWSFYKCYKITNIEFSNNITSIGNGAFYDCRVLENVRIPSGVVSIGNFCFKNCYKLANITIPESVTTIGTSTFNGCRELITAGKIGSGCNIEFGWNKSIPNNAFYEANHLTNVTIPKTVTTIGETVFYACSKLKNILIEEGSSSFKLLGDALSTYDETKIIAYPQASENTTYVIPSTVTDIAAYAFNGSKNLLSLVIPENVKSIGIYAFENCTALNTLYYNCSVDSKGLFKSSGDVTNGFTIIFGDNLTTVPYILGGDSAGGSNVITPYVSKVILGDNTTTIRERTFLYCTKLMNIELPDSLVNIGDNAFGNCESLTKIYIPANVINLGKQSSYAWSPFKGCSSSLKIYCGAKEKQSGWSDYWNYYSSTGTLSVTYGITREQYENL